MDVTRPLDRQKLRSRLFSLLALPLASYYQTTSPAEQLAHLFSDLVLYEGLSSRVPAERLLAVLSDDSSPEAVAIVSKALSRSPVSLGLGSRAFEIESFLRTGSQAANGWEGRSPLLSPPPPPPAAPKLGLRNTSLGRALKRGCSRWFGGDGGAS